MRGFVVATIDAFTDWFGSVACVVETTIVCLILAGGEAVWPTVDPSNLHYLYALTVYSAVTQPALAYAAARLSKYLLELIGDVRAALDLLQQVGRNETDMLRAILDLLRHLANTDGAIDEP